jgi:lipopolysaccharide export system permease protein
MRLTWYIIRLHIGPFLFGTSAVIFIFLLQFIFKFLKDLVGKGLTYGVIGQLLAYELAWMLVLAAPMGVLVATVMAYGKLSGNNELTIVKSSGGSAFRAMLPSIFAGLLLAVGLFYFNDRILPEANHRAFVLQNDIKQLKPTFAIEPGRFSDMQGYSILARRVDRDKNILYSVTIYSQMDERLNVINAREAKIEFNHDFSKLLMTLHDGEVQQLNRRIPSQFREFTFSEYHVAVATSGYMLNRSDPSSTQRTDRTMNIAQMRAIADTASKHGTLAAARFDSLLETQYHPVPPPPPVPMKITSVPVQQPAAQKKSSRRGTRSKHARTQVPPLQTPPKPAIAQAIPSGTPRPDTASHADSAARPAMPVVRSDQEAATEALARLVAIRGQLESESSITASELRTSDQYWVEIHKKYSIPAACLIFVFVGAPLGIVVRRGNFGVSASIALGFFVVYWACLVGGEKLADRAMLSPAAAMWMADVIIGAMGFYLTVLVSRETVTFSFDFRRLRALLRRLRGSRPEVSSS